MIAIEDIYDQLCELSRLHQAAWARKEHWKERAPEVLRDLQGVAELINARLDERELTHFRITVEVDHTAGSPAITIRFPDDPIEHQEGKGAIVGLGARLLLAPRLDGMLELAEVAAEVVALAPPVPTAVQLTSEVVQVIDPTDPEELCDQPLMKILARAVDLVRRTHWATKGVRGRRR